MWLVIRHSPIAQASIECTLGFRYIVKRDSLPDFIILAPVVVPKITFKTACILGSVILSFIRQALELRLRKSLTLKIQILT